MSRFGESMVNKVILRRVAETFVSEVGKRLAQSAEEATRSVHKRKIDKVLGGHLLRGFHHFECIDLDRFRLGDTGLAGGDRRPSCDASHDQSGGAGRRERITPPPSR